MFLDRLHVKTPSARSARSGTATSVRPPRVLSAALLGHVRDAGALPVPEVGLADLRRVLAGVGPRGPGADGLPGPGVHDTRAFARPAAVRDPPVHGLCRD